MKETVREGSILTTTTTLQVKELKALLAKHGRKDIAESVVEKQDLVSSTVDFVTKSLPDLLQNGFNHNLGRRI